MTHPCSVHVQTTRKLSCRRFYILPPITPAEVKVCVLFCSDQERSTDSAVHTQAQLFSGLGLTVLVLLAGGGGG
uniref:Uncharacterized protein n=1 Tax=Globodera rostochiensis TaxID=31243 RepID=A0A914IG76_GLORO